MLSAAEAYKMSQEEDQAYKTLDVSQYLTVIEQQIVSATKHHNEVTLVRLRLAEPNRYDIAQAILYQLRQAGYEATYEHSRAMGEEGLYYNFTIRWSRACDLTGREEA